MSVWRNRALRAAYNQEIFVADVDAFWYIATDREFAEKNSSSNLNHPRAPIFAFEKAQEPYDLLKEGSTVFLILRTDVTFVVRMRRKKNGPSEITEKNVGEFLEVFGVPENNLPGSSLWGMYEVMRSNGLSHVNAALSPKYDLTNSPLFVAVAENPTFGELAKYVKHMFASATQLGRFENVVEGKYVPSLDRMLVV